MAPATATDKPAAPKRLVKDANFSRNRVAEGVLDVKKKPKVTANELAGLTLRTNRLGKKAQSIGPTFTFTAKALVFQTGCLEYLLTELLQAAATAAIDAGQKTVDTHHLLLAVQQDSDLMSLVGTICFAYQGIPNEWNKKRKERKAENRLKKEEREERKEEREAAKKAKKEEKKAKKEEKKAKKEEKKKSKKSKKEKKDESSSSEEEEEEKKEEKPKKKKGKGEKRKKDESAEEEEPAAAASEAEEEEAPKKSSGGKKKASSDDMEVEKEKVAKPSSTKKQKK